LQNRWQNVRREFYSAPPPFCYRDDLPNIEVAGLGDLGQINVRMGCSLFLFDFRSSNSIFGVRIRFSEFEFDFRSSNSVFGVPVRFSQRIRGTLYSILRICVVHKLGSTVLYAKGKILMTKNKVFCSAIALFAGSIFAVSAWAQQPAPKLTMKMLKPDV